MCGLRGLLQMRDAVFRHHEGAAGVDAHHQVEALHVGCLRVGQADGAGIVDADIDAAEFGDGLVDCRDHLRLVPDIAEHGQRLAAGGADLIGGGIDRALELRMRLGGFRGDRDVGAIARGPQRDRKPDAAAAAGDEQRLAFERCHWRTPVRSSIPVARQFSAPSPTKGREHTFVRGKLF